MTTIDIYKNNYEIKVFFSNKCSDGIKTEQFYSANNLHEKNHDCRRTKIKEKHIPPSVSDDGGGSSNGRAIAAVRTSTKQSIESSSILFTKKGIFSLDENASSLNNDIQNVRYMLILFDVLCS